MKLVSVKITNYRSIKRGDKLEIGSGYTTLIGKNNEGKSNILRAIVIAIGAIARSVSARSEQPRNRHSRLMFQRWSERAKFEIYDWKRDFPVDLQDSKPSGESTVILGFALQDQRYVKVKTTSKKEHRIRSFEVECKFTDRYPKVKVITSDRNVSPEDELKLLKLVDESFSVAYIPSVRTADSAEAIMTEALERELSVLETDKEYLKALKVIEDLERPILNRLSTDATLTLSRFLRSVKEVSVSLQRPNRLAAMRSACSLMLDDGNMTELRNKGDGVQSLAALSLMHHAASASAGNKNLLVAIEEPESHLHAEAVHQMRRVLSEFAEVNQVLISSHNPLYIERSSASKVVLVSESKAVLAPSIEHIRQTLGVKISDNLRNAEVVLIVEGESDKVVLESILPRISQPIQQALHSRMFEIVSMNGCSNLSYFIELHRRSLCTVRLWIDNDAAGTNSIREAEKRGLIAVNEYRQATCVGMKESELEDLFEPSIVSSAINNVFAVDLSSRQLKGRGKWSDRVRSSLLENGISVTDEQMKQLKTQIAQLIANRPSDSIIKARMGSIQSLKEMVETALASVS